ncbi:adenylate/guanylate cyclase domain-containing protein [Aestuariispira insulae]|uniref:AAA ATPase-like protein n=1 Tax=Aestuariispira insulae TaxID=1461337 RepID=A0A3D9HGP2_9PROT|nr:adenylate/guanylate cyclase domain-containing protein [Aestuariispira insulae]RED48624.1 AAA ATPase-like protein [Aestuariispira insulae]
MNCIHCGYDLPVGAKFCSECGTAQPGELEEQSAGFSTALHAGGEHRQVTVLFCDIVQSTQLAEELDVEALRDLLLAYQQTCADVIERFEGHISKYIGDGIMAYFGYPMAHEDAPKRAAHSSLEILRRMDSFNDSLFARIGMRLSVRIGIHTGPVVAGEMGAGQTRETLAIVGLTPNLAARLEKTAETNSIALSEESKRLIEPDFSVIDLGFRTLRGVKDPIQVYQLVGLANQVEKLRAQNLKSDFLVGRDLELQILMDNWRSVSKGSGGRIVTIVGDPGIGKTGLLRAFLHQAAIPMKKTVMMACTPYDQHSAFSPILRMLKEEFSFIAGETGNIEAYQIKEWIRGNGIRDERTVGALARLFLMDRQGELEEGHSGQAMRQDIFMGLARFFKSKGTPLLAILEDAHWTDPSTQEFIDQIVRRSSDSPVLLIVLKRPEIHFPWERMSVHQTIGLKGLDEASCTAIIRRVTNSLPLDKNLEQDIINKTDGVPLFVEELTKTMMESKILVEKNGKLGISAASPELEMPASLMDSLMVRLDRLGDAKALAQIASVLGRSFTFDALCALADSDPATISQTLEQLIESDFVVHVEDPVGLAYEFRHALYQKVAYNSLLRQNRSAMHALVVDWIEHDPVRLRQTRPEVLAYHCDQAGLIAKTVQYWLKAGERASQASACEEAVRHLTQGLAQLEKLPPIRANQTLSLRYHVLLGSTLIITDGPGAPKTREVYDKALKLCEILPETKWHFPAYWGWWRISENFTIMLSRAERLVEVAENMDEPEFGLQAHHCNWANSFLVGDHKSVCDHAYTGLQIYENGHFGQIGSLYGGHDPKVCALGELALSKWLTGYPDQARAYMDRCLEWADESGHLGSRLHALDIATMFYHYLRDVDMVRDFAHELKLLGEKNDLEDYLAKGMIFEGWWHIEEGLVEPGVILIRNGIEIMRKVGTQEDFPVFLCMLAEGQRQLGDFEAAVTMLEEGLNVMKREGVAYWAAELNRQYAETLLAMTVDDDAWIDAYLNEAMKIAKKQKSRSLELRSAATFAKVLIQRSKPSEARNILETIENWFTEGTETRDHQEARALLASITS